MAVVVVVALPGLLRERTHRWLVRRFNVRFS